MKAETGDFVGVYTPGADESPVAVYKANLPTEAEGVDAYRFRPAALLHDETVINGPAVVTAAVEHPHREGDGPTHAEVAVAVAGGEMAADESVAEIFRNPAQFAHVLESVTGQASPEVLEMPRDHTNLGPEGTQALGFSATGQPGVVALELHDHQKLAAAA
jgi:hypothetical protein